MLTEKQIYNRYNNKRQLSKEKLYKESAKNK